MEIGVAAKDDGKSAREEGDQRIVDLRRPSTKELGNGVLERVRVGTKKGTMVAKVAKVGG